MLVTALLIFAVYKVVKVLLSRHMDYWKSRGIPYEEPESIIGHLPGFFYLKEYIGESYRKLYDRFRGKKLFGIFHMFKPILVIRDPEEIKSFLTKDFENFAVRDADMDNDLEIVGYNMFFSQDKESWKFMRSRLSRLFSASRLREMVGEVSVAAGRLHDRLAQLAGKPFLVKDLVSDFTAQVAFSCLFGLDTELLSATSEADRLRHLGQLFVKPAPTTLVHGFLSGLPGGLARRLKVRCLPRVITDFFLNMVDELQEMRQKQTLQRKDLFYELMQITHGENSFGVNKACAAAQCQVFYAAGFETSSFTISACLHALAHRPELMTRVQQELDTVTQRGARPLDYDTLKELTYLDMVIAETLRMFPPVPELMRKCTRDHMTSEGHVIQAGTKVVVPVYSLHNDPEHFPEPHVFRPERFSKEEAAARHKYAYLPFGEGPRSCIGMRFGLLQSKLCVASILQKYDMIPAEGSSLSINYSPLIFVSALNKDGFKMTFEPRQT